jgi:hypothetical protein
MDSSFSVSNQNGKTVIFAKYAVPRWLFCKRVYGGVSAKMARPDN